MQSKLSTSFNLDFFADLKTLKLNYERRWDEPFVNDGTFMFSKVTALIAFARNPKLTVSLKIYSTVGRPPSKFLNLRSMSLVITNHMLAFYYN